MRIAVFTDIHHHDRNIAQRHCRQALPLLRDIFARFADPETAAENRPDMAISLGDLIMASRNMAALECRRNDADKLDEVLACFAQTGFHPIHHIHGNHEDKNLLRSDVAEIAARHGMDFSSRVIEGEGLSLVLWSPNVRIVPETNGAPAVSAEELGWLKTTLSTVNYPAMVLTHLPLDGDLTDFRKSSFDGRPNPVFGRKTARADYFATHYPNVQEIRATLEESGKVIACLSGHTHWNNARIEKNIVYISLPSLVEDAQGAPHAGWALIQNDTENRQIQIDVRGAQPYRYRINTDGYCKSLFIQYLKPF